MKDKIKDWHENNIFYVKEYDHIPILNSKMVVEYTVEGVISFRIDDEWGWRP